MRRHHEILAVLFALAVLSLTTTESQAQRPIPVTRIRSPATVMSATGYESYDIYVIRARKNERLTIQITWRKEGDNKAGFSVHDTVTEEAVTFGETTRNEKFWTGRIPKTQDYEIRVWAYPIARYTLRVWLR